MNSSEPKTNNTPQLAAKLGAAHIIFMVIAAAAPLTVIGGNIPLAFGLGNGVGAPVAFVLASILLLIFSVGFVAMTPYVQQAGAFYTYIRLGLGEKMGRSAAYIAMLTYTAIQVGIYGYIGWAMNDLFINYFAFAMPWWIYAFVSIAIVAFFGYRNIDLSSKVLTVCLILELAVVLILNSAILFNGGPEGINLQSFELKNAFGSGLSLAFLFALTGFIGFESAAIYRDETRNPESAIPIATYGSVIIIGLFYAFTAWVFVIAVGPTHLLEVANHTLNGTDNLLLDTAQIYVGTSFKNLIQVLLITSLFACVLSFHNILVRYQYALALKGELSPQLGKIHPKFLSPSNSSILQTLTATVLVVICVLFSMDPLIQVFGYMAGIATIGCITLMFLTSLAVYRYFYIHKELSVAQKFKTQVAPVIASILLALSQGIIIYNFPTITGGSVMVCFLLVLSIPLCFVIAFLRKSQLNQGLKQGNDMC